ncbi:MAG: hydroxyisourate hydrolase [Candidatus Velthaea sp.]
MANLSTHVLDTARGVPAAGIAVELVQVAGEAVIPIAKATTNADGRTDAPLVADGTLRTGSYELRFAVRAYFGGEGLWDVVPVRFDVRDANANYHIPLLVSPWSYSTYRGS